MHNFLASFEGRKEKEKFEISSVTIVSWLRIETRIEQREKRKEKGTGEVLVQVAASIEEVSKGLPISLN